MLWTRYDCDSPPSPRYGHTAVALDARSLWGTELVVIFGGSSKQEGGRRALGDVVVFQVDSGSWFRPELRSAATPGSRAFHCAVGVGMRMFVFGGHVAVPDAEQQSFVRTYFNDMWYLSADSWEWTLLTVPEEGRPCGRDLASMVAIDDDRILLFGGRTDAGKSLNDLWLFEIKGSKWTNLQAGGNVPGARMKHQLVYSPDHRLLFLHGGETSTGSLFDDLWSIRGVDGQEPWQWTQIKLRPRPSGRSGHAMSVFGSSVLCYGGHVTAAGFAFFSQNHFYSKELWVLDLKEMRWAKLEGSNIDWPSERVCPSIVRLLSGAYLMFGGRDRDSTFGDCWWLDMSEVDRLPLPSPRGGEMQQGTSPVDRSSPLPAPAARISTPTTPQPIARAPLETSGSYPGIQAGLSTAASNSAPTSANNLAALHSSLDEDAVAAMMVANTAAELERLRASFGMERVERRPMLRSEPSQATPPAAMVDASLADYGRRSQPQASSGQNPTAVALGRQCLAHCPAGQLRLGDVWLLLADYKRLVGQMDILQAWREPRGGGTTPGRFSQLGAEGVRLGDLEAILAEYQKLVKVP